MSNDKTLCKGDVTITIEWDDGKIETQEVKNTVLATGKQALASSLANSYGDNYDYFISRMSFGEGGTTGGVPKYVNEERTALFTSVIDKGVIVNIDPNDQSQVIFTSVLSRSDANGKVINEMALKMNNGSLYSMTTFGGFTKSSLMQITFSWRISYL